MRFDSVRLSTGVSVNFTEAGDPAGKPVLFLHGWPDSWFTFSRVIDRLPDHARAIAIDYRGFGNSERPGCCYAISDLAADVVAFLGAISVPRVTLIGHSLGTFVARAVALARPDRVERLVLISTGLSPDSAVLREAQDAIADLRDPLPREFVREFQSGTAYIPVPGEFMDRIVEESSKAPARVWRETLSGLLAYDDRDVLETITAPTLLLWGDRDVVFERLDDQSALAALLPECELRVYPETGHCPNWERPAAVADDIASFIGASA